jgi:ABC-type branched-subunit amino acid transport system substrate-binding protein
MYKVLIIVFTIMLGILPFVNLESNYDEKEIRLGMSGPFSGNLQSIGNEFLLGANMYFKYINEQGGIYGRTIRIINKDDKYEPRIAMENVEDLIHKYRVFALFGIIGTPISKVALPIATENRIPYIAPFSGADFLRTNPRNPIVINARTSYDKEIQKLIDYFVDVKKKTKIAVFYQNDSYGRLGLKSVKSILEEKKLELVAEGSYKRNTLSVGHALYEIKSKNPEVIILISATKPAAEFIKRARVDSQSKDFMFGTISFMGSQMLVKALKYKGENIIFSQVVPSPWDGKSEQVKFYRELMDKMNPDTHYSYVSLEGYFGARLTVELFKRVGKDFTKEDYIQQMKKLYKEMEKSKIDESERICKCLNNVYLSEFVDGNFRTIYEEN